MRLPNALQTYLKNNDLSKIKEEFGLRVYEHPSFPLVGFKYDQIESPKYHDIVRECRGTVLERDTWKLVAQPFLRFYNVGDQTTKDFDWSAFTSVEKADGSLIIFYCFQDNWLVNTSGSFGLQSISDLYPESWHHLFWSIFKTPTTTLDKSLTYLFELTSIHNKIVRQYKTPGLTLIGANRIKNDEVVEIEEKELDSLAIELKVRRPEVFSFTSLEEVERFLSDKEEKDPTYEGLVLRDSKNTRLKIKSKTYLSLHRMAGGDMTISNMIGFILLGEEDELISYFPEYKNKIIEVKEKIDKEFGLLEKVWLASKDIETQKEFALAIVGKTKFTAILFNLRKDKSKFLRDVWKESADMILKHL